MRPRDIVLAVLTSVIWGLAFVATRIALDSFSAPDLTALRFLIVVPAILLVPRPRIGRVRLLAIGLFLFTGQFLLLFVAFQAGLPPGVASVTQQTQVFFTVALALGERPTRRQALGMTAAFGGVALIGLTAGADLTPAGLALALAAAFSWAVGNILTKQAAPGPMLPLVVWASLVPPLPALAVGALGAGRVTLPSALLSAHGAGLAAALYLGLAATLVGYALWGSLLRRYPAAAVAPFAFLAPVTGILGSAAVFGERFGALRYGGMALILAGLAAILWPAARAHATQARTHPRETRA